jgi:peptide/nickel transport system substrate-binding protein
MDDRGVIRSPSPTSRLLRLGFAAAGLVLAGGDWAAAQIPRDTVVMVKRIDDIVSLDPAEADGLSDQEVIANLYDRLLDYDPARPAELRGALAQSWGVDADGLRYHFTLRHEGRFATGEPVTAADVAFSLQRVVILDLAPAPVLRQFGFTRENVAERIRAVGPLDLEIDAAVKVAPSLLYNCLTASVASVVERGLALEHQRGGDLGHQWLSSHSAGSGPYHLRNWRPGERYVLDAVADAWGDTAKNRQVIVLDVKDPATQRMLLAHGDADYARDLDKEELAALAHDPAIVFDRAPQTMLTYLALNQRNPYLRRPKVIEALKYLVDYDAIAHGLMGGTGIVHQSFLPQGVLGASDDLPFRFDPALARTLLDAAGLGEGFAVSMDVVGGSPWIDIARALQGEFARAGVRLELVPGNDKETASRYRARRHDIYLGAWGSDYPDPESNAQAFITDDDESDGAAVKTLAWKNSWQDAGLVRRAKEAERESVVARRAALYRELQRDHQRVAPFVFLFQDVAVAAHRRSIDGLVLGPGPDRTLYAGIEKR